MKHSKRSLAAAIALAGAVSAAPLLAHESDQGQSGGMMDGHGGEHGRGMMGDSGMTGPGRMGGMMGGGMMDGRMMGPGMMDGRMMGPGMMGAGMMGSGAMSSYMAGVLELSDEQQEQIEAIHEQNAREHWQLMQQMHERARAMKELWREGAPDPEAVGEAHQRMSEIHGQMLQLHARVQGEVAEVLSDEQRQRLQEMHRFGGRQRHHR